MRDAFDRFEFGPRVVGRLQGLPIVIEPRRPRYVLPDDVPPPTGMTRAEFMAWSIAWLGYAPPVIPDGQVCSLFGTLHMNQATYDRLQQSLTRDRRSADEQGMGLFGRLGARMAT